MGSQTVKCHLYVPGVVALQQQQLVCWGKSSQKVRLLGLPKLAPSFFSPCPPQAEKKSLEPILYLSVISLEVALGITIPEVAPIVILLEVALNLITLGPVLSTP